MDDDAVGADLRSVADGDRSEQLRPRPDRDVVLHRGVALAGGKSGAAQGDPLIEGHVVSDPGGLADHHPRAVVDEQAVADVGGGMDLDPRGRAREGGDGTRRKG